MTDRIPGLEYIYDERGEIVGVEVDFIDPSSDPPLDLAEAVKLEEERSILSKLDQELKAGGFAGSTEIPQLVFLCMYTRFFDQPVSMLIKGPSGSGKSFALRAALKFIPNKAYELYHGMSEKALLYSGLNLEHRYLIIQEAAGLSQGDGRVFIRQLLSEGEVRYATVQSTTSGLEGKDLPPVKGPAGLIMTTTANSLHPEDESRMLSVHADESRERTRAILAMQAKSKKGGEQPPDYSRWHALHDFVAAGSFEVEVPFAEKLADALPVDHFRIDRDFPQVLSLIKAHALMHQSNRDRDESGAILALVDDYAEVHRLIAEPLAQGLEATVPNNIRTVVEAVKTLDSQVEREMPNFARERVSQARLAKIIGRDQSVVSRNVAAAIEAGYLANETPGQGREASLILGERELPNGTVLPPPEILREKS